MWVEGRPASALLDTGSTVTLIHPDLLPHDIKPQATEVPLITVTGERAPMLGSCDVLIQVGDYSACHSVWVARVKEQCLLGMDFLRRAGGLLDFQNETAVFQGGKPIPLLHESSFRATPLNLESNLWCPTTQLSPPNTGPQEEALVARDLISSLTNEHTLAGVSTTEYTTQPLRDTSPLVHDAWSDASFPLPASNSRRRRRKRPASSQKCTREPIVQTAMLQPDGHKESAALALAKDVWEKNCEGLDPEQRQRLWDVLHTFRHSFAATPNDVGRTHLVQHTIETGDARPIRQRPRRLPPVRQAAAEQVLREMRTAGIIEPSDGPWASPVVMVPKKDGTWRFCVDYRQLNDKTIKDSYPLPRIDESLDLIAGSSWFSSLDLRSGYWQVAVAPEHRAKTAFTTGRGLWQFTTMPFGLCNAPATFERLMERVLEGVPADHCLVYLDDLLVHGANFDSALDNLQVVLSRISGAGLKLHPEKCKLLKREVSFLGHRVSQAGIMTENDKIAAVRDWPPPSSLRQLRAFLGLASYYRRFVAGFATIASPLHLLTRKGSPFKWGPDQETAFNTLKQALCQSPILVAPDPHKSFILDTDASKEGLGAVLSQSTPEGERVVAYYSRTFSRPERNYCVTRRELLAVVDSTRHFRHYLCGLPFTIRTDHAALQWLLSFKEPEGQVARWIEQLQAFQFSIHHRAGEIHGNADGLSRRPCAPNCQHCERTESQEADRPKPGRVECCALLPESGRGWRELQLKDPDLKMVIRWLEEGHRPPWDEVVGQSATVRNLWSQWLGVKLQEGVLKRSWQEPATGEPRWQVVVPKDLKEQVLEAHHGLPGVGHFGVTKTLRRLRQAFYWGQSRRDVEDFCRRCDACTARKGPQDLSHAPLQSYQVGAPMDRVAVDVLGPLPRSRQGNRFVLVAIDYFTKWPEAYAMPDQEAETVVEALVQGMFSHFGTPSELHSDQGRNFESRVFAAMCNRLGIRKTRTTPLHPQSDGLVERFMRTLGAQLALTTAQDQSDWDLQLPLVLLACRTAVQESTGCTPALLMLGRELRTPPELTYGRPPDAPDVPAGLEYARRLQDRLEAAHNFARCQMEQAGIRQKRGYDVHTKGKDFHAGDLIWVYGPKRVKGRSPKLDSKWIGPCYVVSRVGEVVYRVRLAPRGRTVVLHRDRMAPYKGSGQPAFTLSPTRAPRGSPQLLPRHMPPIVEYHPEELDVVEEDEPALRRNTFRGEEVTPHGAVVPCNVPHTPTPAHQEDTGVRRSQRRRRPPGHFKDFAFPRGRGTEGGAV